MANRTARKYADQRDKAQIRARELERKNADLLVTTNEALDSALARQVVVDELHEEIRALTYKLAETQKRAAEWEEDARVWQPRARAAEAALEVPCSVCAARETALVAETPYDETGGA